MILHKYFIKKYNFILYALILLLFIYYTSFNNVQTDNQITNKINNLNENNFNKNKYVVYECTSESLCGGWADRLKGIMSAYAWSLLTDRYLLINHKKPCELTNFFEPNEHDWNFNLNQYDRSKAENLWKIDNEKFRTDLEFYTNFNSTAPSISIKNNLDWLEPLSKNKFLERKINSLGFKPNKFKIQFLFREWYQKLFKLNSRLQTQYHSFLNSIKLKKKNKQTKLVCAQVRIGGAREFVSHDAPFTDIKNSQIYWNYIKNNFTHNNNYNVFLTTDTRKLESEGTNELGKDRVIINDGINAHLDRETNCVNVDKTFLDFHSLQNCDMAIISESGFGKLGCWNRLKPNDNLVMFSKKQEIVIEKSADDLFIL